ncbi:class I SAM-dependent methyltransferase [Rhodococcus sp. KBS0724]|uniref:class I SAM-dependent methyltransferase n=1 Tax=Rhodococcus sp. KBS0724 TaxID=1179674 RepID=UPI00110E40D6|nr:class I SAM-dependent methyltransferase [Rhodococcus sp. KBS0724]TSD45571.1 class I SAM-dependent methyltransferase [Rhodococcus sp. KBS0724]
MAQSEKQLIFDIRRYWEAQDDSLGATLPLSDSRTTDFREHPVWVGVIDALTRQRSGGREIKRVADMGSGLGNVSEILVRLGFDVIAVDFSASRSAKAAERLARYGMVSAIESTHRTDRHRFESVQRRLRMLPPSGYSSGPTPVTRRRGTPLSAIADMSAPIGVWADAGLSDVEIGDLRWVTAARTRNWPHHRRILRRDSYFAISGIN